MSFEGVHICFNEFDEKLEVHICSWKACMYVLGKRDTCSKESDEKLQSHFCAHFFLEGVHMYLLNYILFVFHFI